MTREKKRLVVVIVIVGDECMTSYNPPSTSKESSSLFKTYSKKNRKQYFSKTEINKMLNKFRFMFFFSQTSKREYSRIGNGPLRQ